MPLLFAANFDEISGPVLDYSGNNRNFPLTGALARTAPGEGHTDRGLTQTLRSSDAGPPVFGQTPHRTIMAWVRQTVEVDSWVMEHKITVENTGAFGFLYLSSQLRLRGRNAGGVAEATIPRPADNAWHHIAGTYDGATLRLYVDTVQRATAALAAPIRTDADLWCVLDQAGSATTIDDARVFDEALDQPTIAALAGSPVGAIIGAAFRSDRFLAFF